MRPNNIDGALSMFDVARQYITESHLEAEVDWQRAVDFETFTESDLLREAAWVILCSGFRERTVRAAFDHVSLCFCDWESAKAIVDAGDICARTAFSAFRNVHKIRAISTTAEIIYRESFPEVRRQVMRNPLSALQQFPFIGPITAQHLAKNIGLSIAKDDRHLARVSKEFGYADANSFCDDIAKITGEKSSVVDIIFWRYLADNTIKRAAVSLN